MIDKELAGPIATVVAAFAAAIVAIAFGRAQYRIALSQARTAEAQKQIAKAQLDIAQDRLKQDFFERGMKSISLRRHSLKPCTRSRRLTRPTQR
jgi:Flp pilus assembly protein TadB